MVSRRHIFPFLFVICGLFTSGNTEQHFPKVPLSKVGIIPKRGCHVIRFADKKGRYPVYLGFKRITKEGNVDHSYSSGIINGTNGSSGTRVFKPKLVHSYLGFILNFSSPDPDEAVYIKGWVATSGESEVDIWDGLGFGTSCAHGKSTAMYGGEKIKAEGTCALAVTTKGTPKSVGGGITIFGNGWSAHTSWVSDLPIARIVYFDESEAGEEKETNTAEVYMETGGALSLTLMNGAKGFSSFDANASCLLWVMLKEK